MSKYLVDITVLRENPTFRRVMIARGISLIGLGFLSVALPVHVFALTKSALNVSLVMALMGTGMFVGLLTGGTLADLYDRRRLILFARSVCGVGFVGLCLNSLLDAPSLYVIYALSLWDGFFGALGVSGLLGAMVQIVGRDKAAPAMAVTMIVTRFATIASPALGGVVIAGAGVSWNFGLAAFGTFLTVLVLWGLPPLVPNGAKRANPLTMLKDALCVIGNDKGLICLFALGAVMAFAPGIRALFPMIGQTAGFDADIAAGFLYSALPIGTVLGAIFSRRISELKQPGGVLTGLCLLGAGSIAVMGGLANFHVVLVALVLFGAVAGAIGVVQMALVQKMTPDSHLGRINSLYMAQDNLGMVFGAMVVGALGNIMLPFEALVSFGCFIMALVLILRLLLPLRIEQREGEPVRP